MKRSPLTPLRLLGVLILLLAVAGVYGTRGIFWGVDLESEVARLAPLLELGPGRTAGEVGAGSGGMAVFMAERLGPAGRMYATEIDRGRLADIREAVEAAELENVTVLEAGERQTNLPAGCCDAVYMRRVYHHLTDPAAIGASLFEAVRAGGRLAVIDFPPLPGWAFWAPFPEGVPEDRGGHGVAVELVITELRAAGFTLDREIGDWGPSDYCLVFRKPREDGLQ